MAKCLSTDEWINEMWHMHTVAYYSTIQRKELLKHTVKQIDIKNIMPGEKKPVTKNHTLNNSIYMICTEYVNSQRKNVNWWLPRVTGSKE